MNSENVWTTNYIRVTRYVPLPKFSVEPVGKSTEVCFVYLKTLIDPYIM